VLTHLSIQSLTLVDRLDLDFRAGMSVITGETGAGKSIMLGALGLALGDRADSSLIAEGAAKAEISASFDLEGNTDALAWLNGRDLNDDDQCILRRVVSRDGRSRAFINGTPTTLTELKSLSEMLLDIHSQHEHQSLLKKETHCRLLDDFGGLSEVTADLAGRYDNWKTLLQQLDELRLDAEEQSARVQLLSYQADELNDLAVDTGETENLQAEQKRLESAEQSLEKLNLVQQLCVEQDESVASQLARAKLQLEGIDDQTLAGIVEMLSSAQIQVDEAMNDLQAMLDRFEVNPERLQEVESRLSLIYDTARKHRVDPDELPALTRQLQAELETMTNADRRITELEQTVAEAEQQYDSLAEKLTASRHKTAAMLATEIIEQLQSLGMDGATFEVGMKVLAQAGRTGRDDIEFLISTIPGSQPGSLSRIASGGELSRISLAIQVVTAKTSSTPTLVFDEVDVGVGGATAEVVGNLLRKLGANAQIICVTHLPQVAAQGHHHFRVSKSVSSESASTTVEPLDEEKKVDEIARMLGGIEKTDQSVAHAEAMISNSRSS
jgi:DNA repair protein RecN (Recombination protein N)